MSLFEKKRNIVQLFLSLVGVVFVALLLNIYHFRLDLTTEKRYTLSSQTKTLLKNLEKEVYFHIFLDGELPPGFNKLKKGAIEMLEEFNEYGNGHIHFQLINPSSETDPHKRDNIYKDLYERGVQPTNIEEKDAEGGMRQKLIFPGIIVHDGKKETTVNLLKNVTGLSSDVNLNNSIEALEYELTAAIRRLSNSARKSVAFLTGHGELDRYHVADMGASLSQFYNVDWISAHELAKKRDKVQVLVIAQPRKDFGESEKYAVDQYVMNGGKVLWLVDQVEASMDSLRQKETSFAFYKPLNLEDQLFRYGVRLNPDLVMDAQCLLVPVKTSVAGAPARFSPGPWYYSPLLVPPSTHPITRNLNMVKGEFINSIDTVGRDANIRKTILLRTSPLTHLQKVPCPVSLDIVRSPLSSSDFKSGSRAVAVLLEGTFTSVFRNRIIPGVVKKDVLQKSKPTRMIVISDGDIIRNRVRGVGQNRQIEKLGYDRYSRQTYGNRKFLLNCVDYLCDDQGWMDLRSREVRLRMLDKVSIRENRLTWQLINLILPVLLVLFVGVVIYFLRKRRFAR